MADRLCANLITWNLLWGVSVPKLPVTASSTTARPHQLTSLPFFNRLSVPTDGLGPSQNTRSRSTRVVWKLSAVRRVSV